jgi:putative flippase GtrA
VSGGGLSLRTKFARYLLVGSLAAAIDLGAFLLLLRVGFAIGPAAGLGFAVAVVANYLLCSRWVYAEPLAGRRFVAFVLGALGGLLVNTAVTVIGAGFAPPALAKIAAIGIAFGFNFTVNTLVVFARPAPEQR